MTPNPEHPDVRAAAACLTRADALLVCAGAGMSVDSGLPDFRGARGFWRAYPALEASGLTFMDAASPDTFRRDPRLAWGFYGHRLALYRDTVPHRGHALLRELGARLPKGLFVFTSNVDGAFQRAGVADERIVECHGSIHHLQCFERCCDALWDAAEFVPTIDTQRCRLLSPLPTCPDCGGLARPNVLMFGDGGWLMHRTDAQQARLDAWLATVARLAVLEIGAGTTIPTVRYFAASCGVPVIRINPEPAAARDEEVICIEATALAGIEALCAVLED